MDHDSSASPAQSPAPTDLESVADLIPPPLNRPQMGRRQFLKMSAAAVALAAIPIHRFISSSTAQAAASVDLSGPIGKKWIKLGGQSVVGAPTADVVATPDGAAKYQVFENGVIVYSTDWGAMLVSVAIFQKWLSLQASQVTSKLSAFELLRSAAENQVHKHNLYLPLASAGRSLAAAPASETALLGHIDIANLLGYVGFPTQDYVLASGVATGYFERGVIVVKTASGSANLIYGAIYDHYWNINAIVGLPVSEEADAAGGGRYQRFEAGDIYWRADIGAFEVHGAIRDRWLALGGSGGALGYPISDEEPVKIDEVEVGRTARFEHGAIYWSSSTGAWEVMGDIRTNYEDLYGGPAGGLGFPTSGQGNTPTSGGVFNDFQKGVLVAHSSGPFAGIWAFGILQLYIQRLEGDQSEFACGSEDVYAFIKATLSPGGTVVDVRRPTSGNYGGGHDLEETFDLVQVAQSNLVVDIVIDGWDEDGGLCFDDDHLGKVHVVYSIDNLWGIQDGGAHTAYDDGSFTATFSVKNPISFNSLQFRQQMFWSFHNFKTAELTYDQFAATFRDVSQDESVWFHPFNRLYYEVAYKGIAASGNCFGMSLESVFAQVGQSLYSEPIIRFWPDTQNGQRPDPNNPTHQRTINEINIKHGYQVGAESIDWFLGKFLLKQDHDPKQCFLDSRAAFERGDYPILSLSDGYLDFEGHTVRPYRWDDSDPNKWVIYIADPNNPNNLDGNIIPDTADPCHVDIDPNNNTFTFRHKAGDTWTGGEWSGGRMIYHPFHILNHTPRTPFAEVLILITTGVIMLLGDTGQTTQISDAAGRTLYEPGLSGAPTRWDQIRQDDSSRVPNLARVPLTDNGTGPMPLEMYFAHGQGATYKHEIVPAAGLAAGTPYEWVLHSPTLSSQVLIPGTPGVADTITTRDIGTATKAVTVTIPAGGASKPIAWTLAGPFKQRWIELTNLKMVPGQSIGARLANGGFELTLENDGPPTTADMRVQAGAGATPVVVGQITIPTGTSTPIKFDAPTTTLTYTGGTPGNSGWLVSPLTITLTAKDYSSKGIDYTEYSKDGVNWTTYTGPFLYADEGVTTLYYRSKDNDGNLEEVRSREFKIDTRPPQVNVSTDQPTYTRVELFVVHFKVADPLPGSGIDTIVAKLDALAVHDGQTIDLFWYDLGTHKLEVSATDVAGWKTTRTANFELIATLASLRATILRLRKLGEIDSDGIENSLLAKVDAALAAQSRGQSKVVSNHMSALIHELEAQSGKHIQVRAANLLIGDAAYIQEHLP